MRPRMIERRSSRPSMIVRERQPFACFVQRAGGEPRHLRDSYHFLFRFELQASSPLGLSPETTRRDL